MVINGSMAARASENLRVTKKASACLYALVISDLALRGEDIEPIEEAKSREVDKDSSVGSTSVVNDPDMTFSGIMCQSMSMWMDREE